MISSLLSVYQKKRVYYTLVLANIYPFVLASLIWVHLEATLLDNRKAFSLTGRYFHLPRVSPLRYSWISRTSWARKGERRPLCRIERTFYRRKVLPSRYLKDIYPEQHCSFNIQTCYFLARHPTCGRLDSRKCHFLVSIITNQNLVKKMYIIELHTRCWTEAWHKLHLAYFIYFILF